MHRLPKDALIMAPMVDLSHEAYRQLIRSFGGCDLFYSEMLNSRIVPGENPETSIYLKWSVKDDLIFQILGSEPKKMAQAALKLSGYSPWGIDVNMGCWLNKVTVHGWGAALMKDIERAGQVLAAVRTAVQDRPVSVKMRIGYALDRGYMLDFASMLEEGGADFIILHARTVPDGMNRKARWEYIAALKEHVSIPVIGNGDVRKPADAVAMMRQTGCDGVMIGRQALITPWIFRDVKALSAGLPEEDLPDLKEVMWKLLDFLEAIFPPDVALKRFKTGISWLAMNLTFGHHLAKEAGRAKGGLQAREIIRTCFEKGIC
ncbi:MAG TPA: tRNA-dihydrouridine synthase family protein [Deltaproteobacteria bacterium]|jgi:tRNA-dihydrouridine synthase B|nr:tRNA-dihydrouridine synthase family protein [Deltaproteobacteria bacterium]HQJ09861.1 tRNA-dihydrouridine synthase family protein [Deltaproteobacteria bacterium]